LRRPGKLAWTADPAASRTAASSWVVRFAVLAAAALVAAVALGGAFSLALLAPTAVAGGWFAWLDLRGAGRAETAEVAGASAFALVPAGVAAFVGWSAPAAELGTSSEILSRTIARLRDERLLAVKGRTLRVLDAPALHTRFRRLLGEQ